MNTTPLIRVVLAAMVIDGATVLADRPAQAPDRPRTVGRSSSAGQGQEARDQNVRVFGVGAEGALDLSNVAGDVTLVAAPGRDIRIEATRRAWHADIDEARRALDQVQVEMTQTGSRVDVRTYHPRLERRTRVAVRVDYAVVVPVATTVTLRTVSGDVAVTGVRGEVRVEAVSGDLALTGTPQVSLARTVSGTVRARDIGGAIGLVIGTVNGSIRVDGLDARGVECSSVSGDIELERARVERLQAKSVSGDIAFSGPLSRGGRYEFGSHSGDVRVTLPGETGFDLDASSFSGSVRSDFTVDAGAYSAGRPAGRGPRAVRGVYGDGGAVLAVKTFSGDIILGAAAGR